MKTLTKFLIAVACAGLLFACSKSNDQAGGTTNQLKPIEKSSVANKYWDLGVWIDVFCDGKHIDALTGSGHGEVIDHMNHDGVGQWETQNFKGTVTSVISGETFTFSEQDKINGKTLPIIWTTHDNIKGSKGTLYNISFIFTFDADWNMTSWKVKNATCTANSAY
jgi:hypothetical protein